MQEEYSKFRFIRVMQATKRLVRNKEDTAQVFVILEALGQSSGKRSFAKFSKSPIAKKIFAAEKPLIDYLSDKDWLLAQSEDSLARAYYEFTYQEDLSPDGLRDASEIGNDLRADLSHLPEAIRDEAICYRNRQRDAHDLWHVTNGYSRDTLGELSLLAFTYRQLGNIGIVFIILAGIVMMRKHIPDVGIAKAVWEGYRNAGRAAWLPAADWEYLLTRPLREVRAELNIPTPKIYHHTYQNLLARMPNYLNLDTGL